MDFKPEFLFNSPILSVVDIRWRADDPRPTRETESPRPEITFMRTGMFVRRHGRLGTACDPNTLLFINDDEPYRMAHPVKGDCACTALLLDRDVLRELVAELDPAAADRHDRLFAFDGCPCESDATVGHYELLALARASESLDPLTVEETGLALARCVVAAAHRFHGGRTPRRRPSTHRAHADLAEAVKAVLAARFRQPLSLEQVARAVHAAPNHLCTVFKRQTGFTIHQYLTRLRLAAAVDSLADAPGSLATLALDLGFCHHSHFSTAFRQAFGEPPSRVRRRLRPARNGQTRKKLKV